MICEIKGEEVRAALRKSVPWWEPLDAGTIARLDLDAFDEFYAEWNSFFDVVVVGGGVAGLSAAQAAAAAGAKVVMLEKAPTLGAGASGRNAGIVGIGVNMPINQVPEGSEAMRLWNLTAELAAEVFAEASKPGAILRARNTGSVFLAKSATAMKRLRQEVRYRRRLNLDSEIISAEEVLQRTDGLLDATGVHGALWLPQEGRANPLTLLAHLATKARAAGASLVGGAAASILDSDEGGWHLSVNGNPIRCKALIKCTGPLVEANSRIYAQAFRVDLPDHFPVFQDAAPYTYYDYRYGDGYLTTSGGRYAAAGQSSSDPAFERRMTAVTQEWIPSLRGKEPEYKWAVDLCVSADMLPECRRLKAHAAGFEIVGLGALGVLPGIALGRSAGREIISMIRR